LGFELKELRRGDAFLESEFLIFLLVKNEFAYDLLNALKVVKELIVDLEEVFLVEQYRVALVFCVFEVSER
jgi:hypothetical protein